MNSSETTDLAWLQVNLQWSSPWRLLKELPEPETATAARWEAQEPDGSLACAAHIHPWKTSAALWAKKYEILLHTLLSSTGKATIPVMQKIPALLIKRCNGSFRSSHASPSFRTDSKDKQSSSITYTWRDQLHQTNANLKRSTIILSDMHWALKVREATCSILYIWHTRCKHWCIR